jgi:hypothetical protein
VRTGVWWGPRFGHLLPEDRYQLELGMKKVIRVGSKSLRGFVD